MDHGRLVQRPPAGAFGEQPGLVVRATASSGSRSRPQPDGRRDSPRDWSSFAAACGCSGGTENYYFGDDKSLKNDVWSSADGKEWKLETANAGWSPRAYHQAVVLNDKIYVFGGGNYVPAYHAKNDVWSSSDGVHWTCETEAAPWAPRLWFSAAVYRGRMWVLGGWSNNPRRTGATCGTRRTARPGSDCETKTCWKARHEHSAFVFQDKLWIAGGHARPLSNEVWSLHLPPDWQPSAAP